MSRWTVVQADEFRVWYAGLNDNAKEDIYAKVVVLAEIGPSLGRPSVDTVQESRFSNMKELRVQSRGRPLRIFFAFDPKRRAVLLVGGDKTGKNRFYKEMVPTADRIYESYLEGGAK